MNRVAVRVTIDMHQVLCSSHDISKQNLFTNLMHVVYT